MYVGYTESFSVCFFCTVEFLCMKVDQNIQSVNILITYSDNRNDDKTSTFMDGGPSNRGRGPDLTACLVGLRAYLQSHWGRCSTRTGPKYVGSSFWTESLCINVGYTNSFSICFSVNTYDTVHIVLIKIHIVFTIAYNMYWACGEFFFSEIHSPRKERYTLFWGAKRPLSPPKKKLPQQQSQYWLVCTKL